MLVAFFIEVGLLLIVLPWSTFWERNYFMAAVPLLRGIFTNHFARGAVSGIGVVNLFAGFAEMVPLFDARARHRAPFADEADSQVQP